MSNEIAEYLPIKLTPGFIAVSFHSGCIGCNFCSVRYGNARDRLFEAGSHHKYTIDPSEVVNLLSLMPSFNEAGVPLRIGNDTDLRFEMSEAVSLLDQLPATYPVTALSRFPLTRRESLRLQRENLILKLTATPASRYLTSPRNAAEVVASVAHVDTPTVVCLGPLVDDNVDEAFDLLHRVPTKRNVYIYIKPLTDEFHPTLRLIPAAAAAKLRELRDEVERLGFRHLSQLMCPVNEATLRPHKRVADVPLDEKRHCETCASKRLCFSTDELPTESLREQLRQMGLELVRTPRRLSFKSYFADVDLPTGFGDEAFLSESFGCKIKLSGTAAGTGNASHAASLEVLERWEKTGFFPYRTLLKAVPPPLLDIVTGRPSRWT